jgi:hypothetical protein
MAIHVYLATGVTADVRDAERIQSLKDFATSQPPSGLLNFASDSESESVVCFDKDGAILAQFRSLQVIGFDVYKPAPFR